ncbi:ATP-binding cassette domain-containing protein [Paenibacillus sp. J2TS4]|uniref:ATP-binding cassette domain-containing protein n=1 Tax=Paenibacillus sp. J2TS4 TaxID=2807194 RepID=UPI001B1C0C8E|nr:ATP-binding cassette domain-containing protein [Paenibacillus sp. J2TS4]GIP31317.1 energy-coupling factor transporter ATP-binding protein EcfA [Paenibacillus sp. J2TS4]
MQLLDESFVLERGTVSFEKRDSRLQVLSDIQLSIARGEWLGIIGRNGSGKSTLAKVIAGYCPLASGHITKGWIEGRRIGMIGQQPDAQIVGETIYEDVCFVMENEAKDPVEMPRLAQQALKRVGLDLPSAHPVAELSGGQKQLLAIAGWLVTDVGMLIFDEATAMLDPASRQRVLQVAAELNRSGTAIVWITQWMEELAWADRVIALDSGEIAFEGPTSSFFYGNRDNEQGETASWLDDWASTPCQLLGYEQPYAVQVARSLQKRGIGLSPLPVTVEQLSAAVNNYGSSA